MKKLTPLDPNDQHLRPLSEYCARIPSRCSGRRLNRATLWRWALHGTAGGWRLKTVEIGGGRYSCDAWVWAFIYRRPTDPQAPAIGVRMSAEEYNEIAASLGSNVAGHVK